jgi:hypothetical protein
MRVPLISFLMLVLVVLVALVLAVLALVLGLVLPYVEMFLHHFGGNIQGPQCVIFEGTVRTGTPTQASHNSFGS